MTNEQSSIKHFLLVFDHAVDKLVEMKEFGTDSTVAMAEYSAHEKKYRDNLAVDIVLVGSDSLETVKITHGTYFNDEAEERTAEDFLKAVL